MKFYENWKGRASWGLQSISGRVLEAPWALNSQSEQCELNCDQGFWNDWGYWKDHGVLITNLE